MQLVQLDNIKLAVAVNSKPIDQIEDIADHNDAAGEGGQLLRIDFDPASAEYEPFFIDDDDDNAIA